MADAYNLKAGQTLTATVREGRAHIRCSAAGVSHFTRSSAAFGPYLVDTEWLVDGQASVTLADYVSPFNALLFPFAGAPEDAAQATLTINPTGDDNSLIFTARAYGAEGNGITVAYVAPAGATAALAVSVYRQAITVSLAKAADAVTSTAAQVKAAIEAHGPAAELVTVALDEADTNFVSGAGVVAAAAAAALEGGEGTGVGVVMPGGLLIDTENGAVYRNSGTLAAPAWTGLADAA